MTDRNAHVAEPIPEGPDAIYTFYRFTPKLGESSYLHTHYKRGLRDFMRPGRLMPNADAAWRAGRDTARAAALSSPDNSPRS